MKYPIEDSLAYMIEKYRLFKENQEEMLKLFETKNEMAIKFYELTMQYITRLRAFHFKDPAHLEIEQDVAVDKRNPELIPSQLFCLAKLLLDNKNVSLQKLIKLSGMWDYAIQRFKYKLERDDKLKDGDFFKDCIEDLNKKYEDFKEVFQPHLAEYYTAKRDRKLESDKVREQYSSIIRNVNIRGSSNQIFDYLKEHFGTKIFKSKLNPN